MSRLSGPVLIIALCAGMLFAPLQAGAEEALRLPDARVADERIEVAQAREPRNIFELIFGVPDEPTPQQPQQPTRRTTDSTPAAPAAPAPPPAVDKNEGATRMAVIGDSMAVDLANALERFYAEDPNIIIDGMGVGSSGFVRDDFFDWNATIRDAVVQDRFDIAVVIIGVNDRQALRVNGQNANSLTEEWISAYSARLSDALNTMRAAGIPVIWVGMPPMQQPSYSAAISQISGVQRLAAFSGGAEFVDIFERYADEAGNYTSSGPDLNGNIVTMRKSDGIHLSSAGADKLAFYVNQAVRLYYRGGSVSIEIADPLAGTDAQDMIRLPYQGLGQIRLLEVAGAVLPLDGRSARASDLLTAETVDSQAAFELEVLMQAPVGRVDAFGVGYDPAEEDGEETPGER